MSSQKVFDIALLGATGYTGSLSSEYITSNFLANLRWAIAGRSVATLRALSEHLRTLNSGRLQPEIEITQFRKDELESLARKCHVIINVDGDGRESVRDGKILVEIEVGAIDIGSQTRAAVYDRFVRHTNEPGRIYSIEDGWTVMLMPALVWATYPTGLQIEPFDPVRLPHAQDRRE